MFDADTTTPSITISGFNTIVAGSIVSFKILIKHAANDSNITVKTYYHDYNSIENIV